MGKVIGTILCLFIMGCTSSTEFGPCVGIGEDRDTSLVYKISAMNLFWGIIGFSLVAPPIIVVVDETFCPVGRKKIEE
jgi:hypothetical protein